MTKGDKENKEKEFHKISELIYKTSLRFDFRVDLSKIRAKFSISPQDIKTDKDRNDWYATLTREEQDNYWDSIFDLFIKYQLPVVSRWLIDYYVCRDKIIPFSPKAFVFNTCEIDFESIAFHGDSSIRTKWKNCGQPYICFYISDLTTEDEAKEVISKNWKKIKENLNLQWMGKRRVIRPLKDKAIHEHAYFLSLRSRKMLGMKGKGYKKDHIAKLINEKYNKKYSADNIQKIINNQKRLRKKVTFYDG
jgi:hypothetical protein